MRQSQPLHSTAGNAHGLHGRLNGSVYSRSRHDDAGHDDVFDMPVGTAIGSLPRVKGKPVKTVPQVLGVGQATDVSIRHDGRFDKLMLHYFPRTGHVLDTSLMQANHYAGPTTSYKSPLEAGISQKISDCCGMVTKPEMTQRQPTRNQHNTNVKQAGSPSRGAATSQSSAGIESGPANQCYPLSAFPPKRSEARRIPSMRRAPHHRQVPNERHSHLPEV